MKRIRFVFLGTLIGVAVIILGYLVISTIDRSICVQQVAQRIGVEPSYENLIRYVSLVIIKGMGREEVEIALSKLGPLDVHHFNPGISTESADSIWIKMCRNPFNNFWVHVKYNADGELTSFVIDWD